MSSSPSHLIQPPMSAREVLALNLIRLRGQRGWTQEALSFETGLDRTFIAHVERRKRNISLDNIEKLAKALGLSAWELLRPATVVDSSSHLQHFDQ